MSDLELTNEVPSATAQAGAETRLKALFMLAHNDGLTVTGNERLQLSTMLDHHMETDLFWEAYVDDVFERNERECLLRGEAWNWRAKA
jgi:hypothetical protein